MRVELRGGPRNGETHEIEFVGARLVMPGNVEDRRPVATEDGWAYSFPTVVYVPECFNDREAVFRYSHTEAA